MDKQDQFIIEYLKEHTYTGATDQLFHEEYFALFRGRRKETYFGAQMVYKAQRRLKKLWQQGVLERGIIGISGESHRGFPKWVYGYSIKNT